MTVRTAQTSEMDTVIAVLSEAFHEDPVSAWTFPGDERRRVVNPIFFRAVVDGVLDTGGQIDVMDDLSAVILWSYSGAESELDMEKDFPGLNDAELERLGSLFELMLERRPAGDYRHAQFIGVLNDKQGQGIGARLFQHGLDRYAAEGLSAYLEASSPRSAKLYRRLGFRDHGEAFALDGMPPMQPMWRDPA